MMHLLLEFLANLLHKEMCGIASRIEYPNNEDVCSIEENLWLKAF